MIRKFPPAPRTLPAGFRFGVPEDGQLKFFEDRDAEAACTAAQSGGWRRWEASASSSISRPFIAAGRCFTTAPWVAERLAGLREFVANQYDSILPITRAILESGQRFDAVAAFDCIHELYTLRRATGQEWASMDVLLLPTAGTIYTVAEIEADPLRRNANLGYYTTFTNLLDLCAVAVPAGFLSNGLPLGVTLMAPAGHEAALLEYGRPASSQCRDRARRGAISIADIRTTPAESAAGFVRLAVVGAHLSGQPLNHQLTQLNARLVRACRTAPIYRLYALANTKPAKPGLVRMADSSDRPSRWKSGK